MSPCIRCPCSLPSFSRTVRTWSTLFWGTCPIHRPTDTSLDVPTLASCVALASILLWSKMMSKKRKWMRKPSSHELHVLMGFHDIESKKSITIFIAHDFVGTQAVRPLLQRLCLWCHFVNTLSAIWTVNLKPSNLHLNFHLHRSSLPCTFDGKANHF